MKKTVVCLYLLFIPFTFSFCQRKGFNIFPIQQDVELGKQVSAEIENNSKQYPLLPETGRDGKNEAAYTYLRSIVDRILNSGKVKYRKEFAWKVKIVQDDKTLNAFCAPGGYIYVYTGLIKYLDTEDQLAGVLGHEIAHADKRHTTRSMTTQYGQKLLLDIALGNKQGAVTEIARGLLNLRYSRSHEQEADFYSVEYLCSTPYRSDGAAGFFQKLLEKQQGGNPPEFMSTHPNPQNRVQAITSKAQADKCNLNNYTTARYPYFKGLLP